MPVPHPRGDRAPLIAASPRNRRTDWRAEQAPRVISYDFKRWKMSITDLTVFDETVQKTNTWLKEIAQDLNTDRHEAYQALRAVLHCTAYAIV
jgi:hypothetical protein